MGEVGKRRGHEGYGDEAHGMEEGNCHIEVCYSA